MTFLSKEQIIFNSSLSTKDEVIEVICKKAVDLGISNDMNNLKKNFILREDLGSTGIGNGFAIPHARCEYVLKSKVIIVKSSKPIEWQAIDDKPIYMAIAFLVPSNVDDMYMKLLSTISRRLMDEGFRNKLLNAKSEGEVFDSVNDILINM